MKQSSPEQAVFAEALQCATPAARAVYLDGACGTASPLRRRVEALLQAAASVGDFLEEPPTGLGERADLNELTEKPGDRIGRYKLLEKIGEGGCGVVYMAEQMEPVRRRVAFKVIKLGMDTKSVIARFEAERQALALMDHPNIAKVLDGGATATGRPYFVMELVRGVPITRFCDEARLGIGARLRIFIVVCQAVQHAHQKGIIHRDLKPSNILVTINDGDPVPLVIDFGIAKATGQRLTDKTLFTQFHSFIGTPAYTSPEQAEMSSVDVDTRSDIYSLGVLLYELLTGKTPFDGEELLRSGVDEMRRIIRETEPLRPSTRLTSLVADPKRLGAKSESRVKEAHLSDSPRPRVPPTKEFICGVRGDLDWIVMKCLEKDRARRYATVNGLAADIQRHLQHEPVMARSPSRLYLLQKMARRNRSALLTLLVLVAALLVAVITLATSNALIRQERNLKDRALQQRATALDAVRASEQQGREQLFVSLRSQAQARRNSQQVGQRLESLAALAEAARIHPDAELRDSAIAAMTLPDVELGPVLPSWGADSEICGFDPLYQFSASVGKRGISIRRVSDNYEIQRLEVPAGTSLNRINFSPDGRFLALLDASDRVRIWRWAAGEKVYEELSGYCSPLAFSPDSRRVAVGLDGWIATIDLGTGRELRRWQAEDQICMMDFSPDGRTLAAGYRNAPMVSLYHSDDGRLEADLPMGESHNTIPLWHPGGDLLATGGSDASIQIWDVKARQKVAALEGHAQQVNILSFHPDGNLLLSSSWDGTVRLWQTSPGRPLMRLPLAGWIGFSPAGHWSGAIATESQQAQLWSVVPSSEYRTFGNPFGVGMIGFYEGDISPDGRLLAIAGWDGVRLWDIASGREVASLKMENSSITLFGDGGRELLTCGPASGLRRWPIAADAVGDLQLGPPHPIALPITPNRIALAGNNRVLAVVGENSQECLLVDLVAESVRGRQLGHNNATFVAVSFGGERLASSGWHSEQVKIWNGPTGELIKDLEVGLTARVYVTPDDRELIVSRSREFTFYDLKTLEVSRRLHRQLGLHPGHVAFTADGKMMALEMAPGEIHLKETSTGRTVAKLADPHGDLSTWIGFTPGGTQLLVAARYASVINCWDLRAIRHRLKAMNLDWDWPEFPVAAANQKSLMKNGGPPVIKVLDPVSTVPPAHP